MRYLGEALISLTKVGVQFKVRGDTYADIMWLDETITIPSEACIRYIRGRIGDIK